MMNLRNLKERFFVLIHNTEIMKQYTITEQYIVTVKKDIELRSESGEEES